MFSNRAAVFQVAFPHFTRRNPMDILSRLHALPLSRFHYRLLVLIGLGWLFDAMDTGMVSFVLVTLAKEWG